MTDELNTTTPPAGAKNAEEQPGHMIPKARFDEINNAKKELEARLAKLEADAQAAATSRLEEEKKWQELAETYKNQLESITPQAAMVDDWRASIEQTVAAQIERLPEDARDMVPAFPDPRQTLEWLNKNAARLMRPAAPQLDGGARGEPRNPNAELTPEELQMARMMGMDTSDYAAFKARKAKQSQSPDWMQNLGSRIKGE